MSIAHKHFSKAAPGSQKWIDDNRSAGFTDQKPNQVGNFLYGSLSGRGFTVPKVPPPPR